MTWEELLARYRALGGIAENVRLAEGSRGRGVFPIDPSLPARLHTPVSLFVPVDDIEFDGRTMRVKSTSAVVPATREFFDLYQQHFGWGNGGYEQYWAQQAVWHALDPQIVTAIDAIAKIGSSYPFYRFDAPSDAICTNAYINERQFDVHGRTHIVPLIDLVNHSGFAPSYNVEHGLGVGGTFPDEMLVSYNGADAWTHALCYGFASPEPLACSLSITVTLAGGKRLSFERNVGLVTSNGQMHLPKIETQGDLTTFSFVILGFSQAMDLPRTVFRKIIAPYVPPAEADRLYESLHHFNRLRFIDLLRTLRRHEGPLVRTLEDAVLFQLEALSASVGVRT